MVATIKLDTIQHPSSGTANITIAADGSVTIPNVNAALLKTTAGVIGPVVSGTDVKTVGGVSILGAGNIPTVSTNQAALLAQMNYIFNGGL